MAQDVTVDPLRCFGRASTQRVGVLEDSLLGLGLPLPTAGGAGASSFRSTGDGCCSLARRSDELAERLAGP